MPNHSRLNHVLMYSVLAIAACVNIAPRLIVDGLFIGFNQQVTYVTSEYALDLALGFILTSMALICSQRNVDKDTQKTLIRRTGFATAIVVLVSFYCDSAYLLKLAYVHHDESLFLVRFHDYLAQEGTCYGCLGLFLAGLLATSRLSASRHFKNALLLPLILTLPLPILNAALFINADKAFFVSLPWALLFGLNTVFMLSVGLLIVTSKTDFKRMKCLNQWIGVLAGSVALSVMLQVWALGVLPYKIHLFQMDILIPLLLGTTPLLFGCMAIAAFKTTLKKRLFDMEGECDNTSGAFGASRYAKTVDFQTMNAYSPTNGPLIGAHDKEPLYLPMLNKLTISPPGGGKTTASSIPVLLSHDGPAFVFDIKGELWAVTARFRSEVLGRKVVVIDPFNITQQADFQKDKPASLQQSFQFNPFDFIPENQFARDRMINSFAASFVINEGGYSNHFDENAKILIRGYIDYMMSLPPSSRNLPKLYELMSENIESAIATFEEMARLEGRAGAASNQINRVGSDERGSILSTSYRQIDWMGDSNIQRTLSSSNFDLKDFMKGNMDIYVVLPEDQIKEHNRLFRMVMCLLMNIIVTSAPTELPHQKMLFLLEELAQLGACPDVEQSIEVMRARGVVVWTVFQSLKQIECFSKPDLFLSVPLKQIFTNDDVPTMQWVQTLGGKRTIFTKTLSNNTGDNRQKMQAFGGSVSSGAGESIHETATDLIHVNDIRELPNDMQLIFLHGQKPMYCKKVRYFEHPSFLGKFDNNPLESRK